MFNFFTKKKKESENKELPYIAVIAKDTADINVKADTNDTAEVASRLYKLIITTLAWLITTGEMDIDKTTNKLNEDIKRIITVASENKEQEEANGNDD